MPRLALVRAMHLVPEELAVAPDDLATTPASFYRLILDSLAEGVVITDADWQVRYTNQLVTEITGYAPEELRGRSIQDAFFPGNHPCRSATQEANPLSSESHAIEVELPGKTGGLTWVRLRSTPFRNAEGVIVGRVMAINCIAKEKSLEWENEQLQDEARVTFGSIVGHSAALQKVMAQIATVAPTEANVLILGESGTGKELVARAIHDSSARKGRALVRVNCASIPKELFESEFFGHVRGAFTGAIKDRAGRFELANGGTLFLDEIGEIPLDLQGKLLRVLQEGQFERLGDDRTRTVRVRIIAATNRDLLAEARAGRFRLDLYYRLSVFPIELPPLRERPEDIAVLATHFARQASRRLGVPVPRLTRLHLQQLQDYDWPGNVRELQNVIERALILSRGSAGRLQFDLSRPPPGEHGQAQLAPTASPAPAPAGAEDDKALSLDELTFREREIVTTALRRRHWKIYGPDGAAALLQVKPTTLVSMMKRLGVAKPAR
ncbi:MAG TPA: sigma 54-interacting transcriptional regulator [Opitutaceae bacterium]